MNGGISVEVGPCGEKKLLYKAFLEDTDDKGVMVRFLNNLKDQVNVQYSLVRFPPIKDETHTVKEGDFAEVSCNGPSQWYWREGTVQRVKDDFVVVKFCDDEEQIVSWDEVRLPHKASPISSSDIFKFELPVPEKFVKFAAKPNAHSLFLASIKAGGCTFVPETSVLKVISVKPESARLGKVLLDMHLDRLQQRLTLEYVIEQDKKFLETRGNQSVKEEFEMDSRVIGMAVGVGGSNIHKVRQLPGIYGVNLQENKFYISGKSKECVTKARTMLEFKTGCAFVPRYLQRKVLSQENIESFIKKNNLSFKIHFMYNDEVKFMHLPHKRGHCSVLMVGLSADIAAAKVQIEFLVATYTEMQKMYRQLNILPRSHDSSDQRDDKDDDEKVEKDDTELDCGGDKSVPNDEASVSKTESENGHDEQPKYEKTVPLKSYSAERKYRNGISNKP